MKVMKRIRIILLIVAIIACIAGYPIAKDAEHEAATDVTKIDIQVVDKECYFDEDSGAYMYGKYVINLKLEFTNDTDVDWSYLNVSTRVFDKDGEQLGTITSSFGSSYGDSDFLLEEDETITRKTSLSENKGYEDDFFVALYNSDLSDLVFECEVTDGRYIEE